MNFFRSASEVGVLHELRVLQVALVQDRAEGGVEPLLRDERVQLRGELRAVLPDRHRELAAGAEREAAWTVMSVNTCFQKCAR